MKEIGGRVSVMAMAFGATSEEINMRVNGRKAKLMALVFLLGLIVRTNMKVFGKIPSSMARA